MSQKFAIFMTSALLLALCHHTKMAVLLLDKVYNGEIQNECSLSPETV